MADRSINLDLDYSRVKRAPDGSAYIDVDARDFAAVPVETITYWYEVADRPNSSGREIPVNINIRGGKLSPAENVNIVFHPSKGESFVMATSRPEALIDIRRNADTRGGSIPLPLVAGPARPMLGETAAPAGIYAAGVRRSPKRPGETTIDARTFKDVHKPGRDLKPTLSDQLMFEKEAFPGAVPRKVQEAVKQAHRTSRAFVFDRAASYRVGEICAYSPDLVADQQEFARAPYPRTFIELDAMAVYDAFDDAGLETYRGLGDEPDRRIGFLITERGIYVAASHVQSDGSHAAGWTPFAYRPHQPMRFDQEQRFIEEMGASRMQIDHFMWGSSYDLLSPAQRRSIRAQHGLDFLLPQGWSPRPAPLARLLTGGGAGDMRLALCAQLLLIRPNLLQTTETREPGRKLVMGKPTVFIAHRVVTIKLTPDQTVRKIRKACKEEAGRQKARWHEVRGHYMHNHRAKVADCAHDWEEVDPLKWECRGCGGRRAWRTYPEGKGDASVGVVTKHYVVKR